MAVTKTAPDWERIEAHFRAGLLSLREIATGDGNVTEGAIRKRAKRDGWSRDLKAKIQARADDLVRKEAVRSEVRANQAVTEQVVVEANAQAILEVRMRHRTDLRDTRNVALQMLQELRQAGEHGETLDQIAQMVGDPEADENKLRQALHKAISLPSRVTSVKNLAETLTKLIACEREAFGLDDKTKPGAEFEDMTDADLDARIEEKLRLLGR